jgi:hypothetical protein
MAVSVATTKIAAVKAASTFDSKSGNSFTRSFISVNYCELIFTSILGSALFQFVTGIFHAKRQPGVIHLPLLYVYCPAVQWPAWHASGTHVSHDTVGGGNGDG